MAWSGMITCSRRAIPQPHIYRCAMPGGVPCSHSGRRRCRDASRSPQWTTSLTRCVPQWVNHIARSSTWLLGGMPSPTVGVLVISMPPASTGCLVYIKAGLLVLCRSALMSCGLAVTCGGHCWLSSSAAAWCLERRSFLVVSLLLVSFSSLRSISLRSLSMTLYSR